MTSICHTPELHKNALLPGSVHTGSDRSDSTPYSIQMWPVRTNFQDLTWSYENKHLSQGSCLRPGSKPRTDGCPLPHPDESLPQGGTISGSAAPKGWQWLCPDGSIRVPPDAAMPEARPALSLSVTPANCFPLCCWAAASGLTRIGREREVAYLISAKWTKMVFLLLAWFRWGWTLREV